MPPQDAKVRVFISHSAKEEQAQAVQKALVEALKAPGREKYGVLLDEISLKPGDMWRSRINLWVGGCDAAVILLSNAALESAYVAYEASILSYRRTLGDSLLLIPVLLGDVDEKKLRQSRLSPAQLQELQAVRGRTTEEIVQKVVQKLEDVGGSFGETPIERRARHLADRLAGFSPEQLRFAIDASRTSRPDLDPWIPSAEEKLRLRLAVQLQSVGMKASVPAILRLRDALPKNMSNDETADWVQAVLDLVASSWVDLCAVDRIPKIAKEVAGAEEGAVRCAIGVNASLPLTAQMYVLCAKREEIEGAWYFVPCDGIVGEDRVANTVEKLIEKIGRVVADRLGCDPEDLPNELEALNWSYPQPVVVALPRAGITSAILSELRDAFPRVTFFLLMGKTLEADGAPLEESLVEMLIPELAQEDEVVFSKDYTLFAGSVRFRPAPAPRGASR